MTAETILVVEDDGPMRQFLGEALASQGFRVAEATTLAHAERVAEEQRPVVVLLDLGLPDGDGIDLLRKLRLHSRVPILVVSGRTDERDKVTALDAGAVDYLTKPFGAPELLARIRVALRHHHELPVVGPVIEVGPIRVDRERREVKVDGTIVHLTPTEFDLLTALARNAGKVVTHGELLGEVWGPEAMQHTHYLRVHLMALRRKIEVTPARPRWLITEPGIGYRLRDC